MSLVCSLEERPDGCLVCIRGHADTAAVADIDRAFLRVTAGRQPLVVLDLSDTTFVSSLAMGSLLNLHKSLKRTGRLLRLAAVQPLVADAFSRVRLQEVIEVCDTVTSAFGRPAP